MMHRIRLAPMLVLGTILTLQPTASPVVAQELESGHCPGKLEELNVSYRQQLREVECRWIDALAELADNSSGPVANDAYRQLFNLALARDLCIEAKPAARNCLASIPAEEDVRALAAWVHVFARAENGEYEQSLADLKALFKELGCAAQPAAKSHAATALAVGEAYLQRLIRDRQYDVARELCELACSIDASAALKDHFEARMARLDMLGKPAPVRFAILGVNPDAKHSDVKDAKTALPTARQFLVRDGVTWIDLLDCQKTVSIPAACGVSDIPANFLIGRDGRMVAVEQSGDALERAIIRALGGLCSSDFK
jgi:hypothetical protein